jgi:hypothetical protein
MTKHAAKSAMAPPRITRKAVIRLTVPRWINQKAFVYEINQISEAEPLATGLARTKPGRSDSSTVTPILCAPVNQERAKHDSRRIDPSCHWRNISTVQRRGRCGAYNSLPARRHRQMLRSSAAALSAHALRLPCPPAHSDIVETSS